MLIVKPYGRTKTQKEKENCEIKRQIILRKRDKDDAPVIDITELKNNPNFIIAQWISVIDKIIKKPRDLKNLTKLQDNLRNKLGKATWEYIEKKKLLGKVNYEEKSKVWLWKLHPYWPDGKKPNNPLYKKPDANEENNNNRIKGRWYNTFIGNKKPEELDQKELDCKEVIEAVYNHLYKNEQYLSSGIKEGKKTGRIDRTLNTIKKSKPSLCNVPNELLKDNFNKYSTGDDLAKTIYNKCKEKKHFGEIKSMIFEELYNHYGKVFGKETSIENAHKDKPNLYEIHEVIRSTYRYLLGKKGIGACKLPENNDKLWHLITNRRSNMDIARLIRLGKIIHYNSTESDVNLQNGTCLEKSPYFLSEGQAEIKRNEALVRVWKLVISQAQHSLTHWAGSNDCADIFTGMACEHIKYDDKQLTNQAKKLFGERNSEKIEKDEQVKEWLVYAIEQWKNLRNNTFHFKNRESFLKSLKEEKDCKEKQKVPAFIEELWANDLKKQDERLTETMKGLKCQEYFNSVCLSQFREAVKGINMADYSLPKFNNLLQAHTNRKWPISLPQKASSKELEKDPWRRCQYTMLKMLYERDFPDFLNKSNKIGTYIQESIEKSGKEAIKINRSKMACSRAEGNLNLDQIKNNGNLSQFLRELSSATANEFRVQRGYGHDAEAARKQSEFIEKLKQDVFVQAFSDYLKTSKWDFLLKKNETTIPDNETTFPEIETTFAKAEYWQKRLYSMLFMVPVDAVSTLLHQIRKWDSLSSKAQVVQDEDKKLFNKVLTVFGLYLDMHDARFDGGVSMSIPEDMKKLFEDEKKFDSLYIKDVPTVEQDNTIQGLPLRGIRELLRFGLDKKLFPIYKECKVRNETIEELAKLEEEQNGGGTTIQKAQDCKQKLHEEYLKHKNGFSKIKKNEYEDAVKTITKHRECTAQVRFTNHIRLYRLTMAVLSRLIDFVGLWERDLYFVTLGLMRDNENKNIADFFKEGKLNFFNNGQIVQAIRNLKCDTLKKGIEKYIYSEENVLIRNKLAHMNMLRNDCPLNLTHWVNQTRCLMSYDRKLKNAVSKSIIELFNREGLTLKWEMREHQLVCATVEPKTIKHLGGSRITEPLHGKDYGNMVAKLMHGCYIPPQEVKQQYHKTIQ